MYIANIFGERYADQVLPSVYDHFHSSVSHPTHQVHHRCCLSRQEKLPSTWSHRYKGYVQKHIPAAVDFLRSHEEGGPIHAFICGKPSMCDEVSALLQEDYAISPSHCTIEKY